MRGTCSEGFLLSCKGHVDQIVPRPFSEIAAQSMLATSHILWSSVWFGIASDAVARTRAHLRAEMRRRGEASPAAPGLSGLSDLVGRMLLLRARLSGAIDSYEATCRRGAAALPMPLATDLNLLKTSMSEGCLAVVQEAMRVAGFAAYRNDSPASLGRHLRDLHSAPLMISNSRHVEQMATALLVGQLPFDLD
jgi:acyl-CoA dehydrogenase